MRGSSTSSCHLRDTQGDKNAGLSTGELRETIPCFPWKLWMENQSVEVVRMGIRVKTELEK